MNKHVSLYDLLDQFRLQPYEGIHQSSNGAIALSEHNGQIFVEVDMPGVLIDQIGVHFDPKERLLKVHGSKKEHRDGASYHVKSRQSYLYELQIPQEVDVDAAPKAELKDGVLTISFAKAKNQSPLKIEVQKGC